MNKGVSVEVLDSGIKSGITILYHKTNYHNFCFLTENLKQEIRVSCCLRKKEALKKAKESFLVKDKNFNNNIEEK